MRFFRQIRSEIINIFRSKFLLIIGTLILLGSIASPVITALSSHDRGGGGGIARPMPATREVYYDYGKPYMPGSDPITIDGVTITNENPFYYNVRSIQEEQDRVGSDANMFSSPQVLDIYLDLLDEELQYYLHFATYITSYDNYLTDLAWRGTQSFYDRFIYENYDPDTIDMLQEAVSFRYGIDPNMFDEKYVDITSEERLQALDEANEYIDLLYSVVANNDFAEYIDLRIQQENMNIEDLQDQIAAQEQLIVKNPSQEDSINQYIEDMQRQIDLIETNTIPMLEYRLQKNIIPNTGSWQNQAISDIENNRSQLAYTEIVSEEEYSENPWMPQEYGSYANYVATMQKQIDEMNNTILIAQRCLDTETPDMKYVPNGSRSITVNFLNYSTFLALFAVLVGGWVIASEFQQGTIRLLMIRPKSRTKILMSKFLAGILTCLGIYLAGTLLNIITNGICFGFSDFAYPNFTISGEINFFAYYIPRFLACAVPILFGFCVAFMLSVLIRNIAAAIAIPIFCFIGSFLAMQFLSYRNAIYWIIWTPIPFVQIAPFFARYSVITSMLDRGIPVSLAYGIPLLLVLSAVCTLAAILVFKKRDITN
jgi:ABC-2 type transport system permease protein